MTSMTPLMPRQSVPSLEVPLVGGGTWRLADQKPGNFTLVVFYRGLHCPLCARYLGELERTLGEYEKRGVSVVVISSDSQERAAQAKQEWKLPSLAVGYGLDLDTARAWGALRLVGHRQDLGGYRGTGAVQRARPLPDPARRNALLRDGSDNALRPPELPRDSRRARFRHREGLPGARRGDRSQQPACRLTAQGKAAPPVGQESCCPSSQRILTSSG